MIVGNSSYTAAVGDQLQLRLLHGGQQFAHMLDIFHGGLFRLRKPGQKRNASKRLGFHENQFSAGPGPFFPCPREFQDGIQNRIDAQPGVPSEQQVHAVDHIVAHGVGGVFP